MMAKYRHTNIVAADWRALSRFYQEVFGCVPVPPERDLSGPWLDRGTGVKNARIRGVHLRLPGHGDSGPTLEIFQYDRSGPKGPDAANRKGLGHIAFEVEDVERTVSAVIEHGGRKVGDVASSEVRGVGLLTFVYLADPEGNIVELLSWSPAQPPPERRPGGGPASPPPAGLTGRSTWPGFSASRSASRGASNRAPRRRPLC